MKKINRILVAVDLSQMAVHVLKYAAETAGRWGARLILIHVINQRDVDAIERASVTLAYSSSADSMETYLENLGQEHAQALKEIVAEAGCDNLPMKRVLKVGVPAAEILESIGREQADLLVMGNRGRGQIAGMLLGSTAEKVFRRCPVPLLSVRQAE